MPSLAAGILAFGSLHGAGVTVAMELLAELGRGVSGKVLEDATLLVSELVTNAVRHAPQAGFPQVELRLKVEPERVRVVVSDPGGGFDAAPRLPTASESSGWGLYLVDRIADRWGVITKDRNEVWFEIDVDG